MKIAYLVSMGGTNTGVKKKIFEQMYYLNKYITVKLVPTNNSMKYDNQKKEYFDEQFISKVDKYRNGISEKYFKKIIFLYTLYKHLLESNYDLVLYRYNRLIYLLPIILSKKNFVLLFESIIENEHKINSKFDKLILPIKKKIYLLLMHKCSGYIGVTGEILNHYSVYCKSKNHLVLPNSIFKINKITHSASNRLIMIGSLTEAHGIDRIIKIFDDERMKSFELVIVGDGPVLVKLTVLKDTIKYKENIKFIGIKNENELMLEIKRSLVGIGSLGLHRYSLNEACPLKTREYLSYGLPIIIGYKDTDVNNEEFVMSVPANDEPISVDEIIRFCNKIKCDVKIHEKIYAFVNEKLLLEERMKILINFLQNTKGIAQ